MKKNIFLLTLCIANITKKTSTMFNTKAIDEAEAFVLEKTERSSTSSPELATSIAHDIITSFNNNSPTTQLSDPDLLRTHTQPSSPTSSHESAPGIGRLISRNSLEFYATQSSNNNDSLPQALLIQHSVANNLNNAERSQTSHDTKSISSTPDLIELARHDAMDARAHQQLQGSLTSSNSQEALIHLVQNSSLGTPIFPELNSNNQQRKNARKVTVIHLDGQDENTFTRAHNPLTAPNKKKEAPVQPSTKKKSLFTQLFCCCVD